jgi:hypothetical protein
MMAPSQQASAGAITGWRLNLYPDLSACFCSMALMVGTVLSLNPSLKKYPHALYALYALYALHALHALQTLKLSTSRASQTDKS